MLPAIADWRLFAKLGRLSGVCVEMGEGILVELDRISKSYDRKVAVKDLSLAIGPGTMFGLLGPNGAGKTSSIRMMIGITRPDSGTVSLFGQPFRREGLKRVGYLPEER